MFDTIDLTGLGTLAQTLDGIEDLRIATENRYRQLTRTEEDSDGGMRGQMMPVNHPVAASVHATMTGLQAMEHEATLALQREFRRTPFAAWQKQQKGVGEKQLARLLSSIGDPYWHVAEDRPRTVSELWAYSGYSVIGGSAQRRARGAKANWSADARMRAYLVATSCVKSTGRYRGVYDAAREQYADAVHATECVRCGPAGKPAQPGSPVSLGHQHARAQRRIAKELLKDLLDRRSRIPR